MRKSGRARAAAVLLMLLVCPVSLLGQTSVVDEARIAGDALLCDCGCHPQSVNDCACGRAAEMREEIAALVAEGLSSDEVVAKYVASSGEQIRIVPTADHFNLVAWLGPFVGLAAGGVWLAFALRRWQRRAAHHEAPTASAPAKPNDPYMARLERELRELE